MNSANKKTAVLLELKVHLKMYDEILIGQQFFVLTSFLSRISVGEFAGIHIILWHEKL